jgi:signal transduction histidine kinase
MLKLSLATRIALIVMLALMVVWIGALAQFYRSLRGEDTQPSPRQVAALVELVETAPVMRRPLILSAFSSNIASARIDREPLPAADPANVAGEPARRRAYQGVLGERAFVLDEAPASRLAQRFPRLFDAADAVSLRIALRTGETLTITSRNPLMISRFGLPVGFGAGLFGTLVALIALLIMHRETRPLVRLAAAVDRTDLGGPAVPLPSTRTSSPEIRTVVAAFERLQARVAQLLRARMAMLGGISHDVRTFATRLRLRVEQIPEGTERERAIADISDMIRLLDDALLASRAGVGELATELVDLDGIVRAEVDDRRSAGGRIDAHIAEGAIPGTVLGDRVALRRIVANLADNALKYGEAAHLALAADGSWFVLTIDDEGPGIPAAQRELLLEPFTRLEASRSRGTGGAGLGLGIVRSLVEAMGGSVAIGDAPGGGARITVRLPAFKP